jgi:hypothetical protein
MSDGDKYRRFAEECMRLSDKAKNLRPRTAETARALLAEKKPPGGEPSG